MGKPQVKITRPNCPRCSSSGVFLGFLFESSWNRCKKCGREYSSGVVIKPSNGNKGAK